MQHKIPAIVNAEVIQSIGSRFTRLLTFLYFDTFQNKRWEKQWKKQRTLTWWLDVRERGKGSDKWLSVSCRTTEWAVLSFLRLKHRRRKELVGWGWVQPRSADPDEPLGSSRECMRGFLSGSDGEESACNAGDRRRGCDPWVGKIPWWRAWQPTPVSLPYARDRGARPATVHGVAERRTRLSD